MTEVFKILSVSTGSRRGGGEEKKKRKNNPVSFRRWGIFRLIEAVTNGPQQLSGCKVSEVGVPQTVAASPEPQNPWEFSSQELKGLGAALGRSPCPKDEVGKFSKQAGKASSGPPNGLPKTGFGPPKRALASKQGFSPQNGLWPPKTWFSPKLGPPTRGHGGCAGPGGIAPSAGDSAHALPLRML